MTTERAEFEAWAKDNGIDTGTWFDFPDVYKFRSANNSWAAWQASRQLTLGNVAKVCGDLKADWRCDDSKKCIDAIKELLK